MKGWYKQVAQTKKKTASSNKNTKANRRQTKNKKSAAKAQNINACIMINIIVTVLLTIFIYTSATGIVGNAIKNLFKGLFGFIAYTMPAVCAVLTGYIIKIQDTRRYTIKLTLAISMLVIISAVVHLPNATWITIKDAYECGTLGSGGGLLGAVITCSLTSAIGVWAAGAIETALLIIFFCITTKVSVISIITSFIQGFSEEVESINEVDASRAGKKAKTAVVAGTQKIKNTKLKPLTQSSIDLSLDTDYPPETEQEQETDESIEFVTVNTQTGEILDDTDVPVFDSAPNNDNDEYAVPLIESTDTEFSDISEVEDNEASDFEEYENSIENDYTETEPVREFVRNTAETAETVKKADSLNEQEKQAANNAIDSAISKPILEYKYPPIDLLAKPKKISNNLRKEMHQTSAKLVETFKNFGIAVKVLQVTQGPSVTRYEIQPDVGIKLSKITGLADDLALNLAVPNVLIAPVPGKAAIGVEIPNQEVSSVAARELLESDEFKNSKSKLTVALGKDIGGRTVIGDIAKMPHVLIAGATGSGKSVCINTLITSILYKAHPDEVKLIMVDPKVVELGIYNGIPHLLIPVVTDPKQAASALNWAVQQMMKRYDMFAESKVRNLAGYNQYAEKNGLEKIPQLVIIIDELADLMMVAAKEVEDYVCRLAQLARAAGIHLVIATQRPSVDVITGLIKANVPSRIAFAVSSQVDSRTILDKGGAEKLLGKGDMLYHPSGMPSPVRVQGAFVSDEEIENIVEFLKENTEENTFSQDLAEHIERCATGENGVTPDQKDDGDKLLPTAIELALQSGQISTSMIQRRLNVGYARAGRIIDQMEARGIISGADGSKPRQVLVSHSDLL